MDFFRETTFWPCALKFLHTLQIGQVLLAHTPIGMGFPPPKKNNRKHLKFVLKFSDLRSITSGLMAVSSRDFFQSMSREAGVITWAQFLQGRPPKICDRQKSSKILRDFWQLSTLIANISGTNQQIENRNSSWKSTTPPTLDEEKLVYFGPQTKKLLSWINLHPNGLFSGDYISALTGCCALKFLHALKTDQTLLAHTTRWDGVPQKILIAKI